MLYLAATAVISGVGFSSYAQLTSDAYTVKTVHIFPSQIQADGWENAETLTFQNLDEYALLQDFNAINSATLGAVKGVDFGSAEDESVEEVADVVQPVVEPSPSSTTTEAGVDDSLSFESSDSATTTTSEEVYVETEQSTTTDNSSVSGQDSQTEPEQTVETQSPEAEVENDVDVAAPTAEVESEEPVTDDSEVDTETATTTVLREVRSLFRLAIDTITETLSSSSPETSDVDQSVEAQQDVADETPVELEDVSFGFTTSQEVDQEIDVSAPAQSTTSAVEVDSESDDTVVTTDVASTTTSTDSVTEALLEEDPSAEASTVTEVEDSEAVTEVVDSQEGSEVCLDDCGGHVLRLSNFGFPLSDGVEISGAQLRMSFAAQHKPTRETIPSLVMNYSFDGGDSWSTGGSVVIDDEVSNSINGGYFLFALPTVDDPTSLANLQIELRYDSDQDLVNELYVDSVWLELFTLEPSEEPIDPDFEKLLADDGFVDSRLAGDALVLPDGEVVNFTFTDENTDETLIIKSDRKTYDGVSEAVTYFSVTNTSDEADDFTIQTYFPREVGEVTNMEVFNINKPRQAVIPEYRPYVYHCDLGWEPNGVLLTETIEDLSVDMLAPAGSSTVSTETFVSELAASTAEENLTASSSLEDVATQVNEPGEYSCQGTSIVQECESFQGDNTACVVTKKITDHNITTYAPGWDPVAVQDGQMDSGGFIKRVGSFLGFGPQRKEVPDTFEGENFSDDSFAIAPGETRYFKMEIAFPAYSSGEYWIEAIGNSEYGLLDPFWSSQWQYRMPITIDNTSGPTLTEQQVFLELDSAMTDFWTNVADDGGDIRFIQETVVGNQEGWYGTGWNSRAPITIQASQVDSDLVDFPVYVNLADLGSTFFAGVQASGADIRVTESDGFTELPIEVVSVDTGSEAGELHFKASDISSSVDTTFYVYYENPNVSGYGATDTFGADNVWSSDYIAVYHMEEAAAGRGNTGLYQDSTSNNYDADDELNSTGKSGLLGAGQEVDAQGDASEYILLPSDIVNGENQLTFSYWMNSSETNNQALINGGAGNEYLIFMQSAGTVMNLFPGGTPTVADVSIAPAWRHVMVSRDASANQWRIFIDGVEDNDSPSTATLGALAIPDDCLVIGLEQDTSCLFSGDTSQHTNATIDEMRFYNTVPADEVISATYRNQATTTDFYNVGTTDELTVTTFAELDHWVQYFSTTTDQADIWVQVDNLAASASTTIYLYYGSNGALSTSDEYTPFTYSAPRELYYVVSDLQSSPIVVYSLIDNNEVSIDGNPAVTLQSGETTSFATYSSSSVISALGPITAKTADVLSEPPVPISFATTTNLVTTNRTNETFYVYAPFADAAVEIYEGANVAPTASSTVTLGSTQSFAVDITGNDSGILESDEPVLLFQSGANDSYVAYPPTTRDLYGIFSQNYNYAAAAASTDVAIYCSDGVTNGTTTAMTRGGEESNSFCSPAANGLGDAVRLTNATNPVAATQEADADGGESTRFLPTPEFGSRYIVPQSAEYISIACAPKFGVVNIEVLSSVGSVLDSGTCTPSGEFPGALNITPGTAFTQGSQVVSTDGTPFYMYYEHEPTDDETNTWSAVQARQFGSLENDFSVGAQEINIDAEYEQYSYAWYENVNAGTPTELWSLGDDGDVVEGQAISGQGAVNSSDILRLRMSLLANVATGTASSTSFGLQYAAAETCSTASNWQDLGRVGSTTAAFSGFNNASIDDGDVILSALLASTTVFGTYEEASLSAAVQNEIAPGEVAEWDWVITNSNASVNTDYCFRMVRGSGDALSAYSSFPQLLTSGPPFAPTLLERFDNEHATSTRPTLEFVASDLSGDDVTYEIQIDDDVNFGSPVFDQDSAANFLQFENTANLADKNPFTSGQVIRYTPNADLTSSTTYWWRVRAIDVSGSNTFSDWSDSFSFTINESLEVSEWFQTTDEQFDTNSLVSAVNSGSDSIVADLGGSSIIGEYGSVAVTNGATSSVALTNTYTNPVVTASIEYSKSVPNGDQPSARVFNKTGTGFDVLTNNFTGNAPGGATVHYVVMEAGEYLMDDGDEGLRVFATSTSVSGYIGSSISGDPGLDITFPTSFSGPPAVLTMVTTNNDPDWILSSVYDGNTVSNPPSASQMGVYIQDNIASDGHTSAEDVDIIAFDEGFGSNGGILFDIFNTGISANFVDDTPDTFTFNQTFSSVPAVTAVQQLTMNGAQGGYAMVDTDTPTTVTGLDIAVEEGGTTGARTHADEDVAVVVFEAASGNIGRAGSGQVTSSVIDFDDADVGNAWGSISFNDAGDVTYRIQYNTGAGFVDIPDSALPGNSTGFTDADVVNILDLDTDTYNQIRLVADLVGVGPEIFDWKVTWGQRVNIPTLGDPFDNERVDTTTPTFDFVTTDPQGDSLVYEISISTDNTFETSSSTFVSDVSGDFSVGSPYASGATVTYTVPGGGALTDGETYWWRVRATDANAFSPWSEPDSFTVNTATVVSTWFQTTKEQFIEGELDGVTASTSGSVEISEEIGEYGSVVVTNNAWTTVTTDLTYNNMVVVASPEYAYNGTTNGRTVQVFDKTNNSFQIKADNYTESLSGTTSVDYIVMEAGDWLIVDGGAGTRIVAGTAEEVSEVEGSIPGYDGGRLVDFNPDFSTTPGALTTVSTANGSEWVATAIDDGTAPGEITAAQMFVALGVGLDTNTVRVPEDIDYIAFETGIGTNNAVLFDAFNTGNVVTESETESTIAFNQTFASAPGVIVVQNNGTNGADGGFAQVDLDTVVTATEVDITVAEMGASAGNHATEVVSLFAFETDSGTIRRESTISGGLQGSIASENILFTDGTGPKFAQALFATTSPGTSSTSVQVEFQELDGSWSLIPDAQIPGNSTGNTISPIDLTNVDVSLYQVIRLNATLLCDTSNCPTLDDWTIEWSEGVPISGTIAEYDRSTAVTSGTVQVAVNGLIGNTGTIAGDGTWTIGNVTAFDGDTVTVWVQSAADDTEKAVGAFVYDGIGDMNNIELFEQHLSLSADENGTTTNADLSLYDNSVSGNPNIFFDVDVNNDLAVCAVSGCSEANLYIGPGDIHVPDTTSSGNVAAHDFVNDGTFELDGNTLRLSGSWDNNATVDMSGSTVIMTATSTAETLDDVDGLLDFNNITFGETSGAATWQTLDPLDIDGDLTVDFGTLDRTLSTINVAGGVSTGVGGLWVGLASTTFDGGGSDTWSDASPALQDIGYVLIDGSAKQVTVSSDVLASQITVGANDTLNAGGSNVINITGDFVNTGTFSPQTSTLNIVGTSTDAFLTLGASSLFNLTASSVGGSVSFTEPSVTLQGDLTIATGTVTAAPVQTTINGSLANTGGAFAHNNGLVRFTSATSETIQLQGTTFLNSFYDVSFTGSGDWTFLDTNATTTNTWTQTAGAVVMPTGTLTVGRDFTTSGSGAFDANGGEVILLVAGSDMVTTNGSAFNDVRIRESGGGSGAWYDDQWSFRIPITVRESEIDDDLTDFPVYVDLANLPSDFFSTINADGGDIRVTESDGLTEVAREIVAVSTLLENGEMYFQATDVSSTTDTIYYLYYGNVLAGDYAVTDPFGAENVWSNGYVLVAHMNDLTTSTILNSANGSLNGTKSSAGNPNESSTGKIYEAQEDDSSDHIAFGNLGGGATNITISAWFNSDDLNPGAGDNDTFGQTIFSAHTAGAYTWLAVGGTGGGGSPSEARFCAFDSSSVCDVSSGANLQNNTWHYVSAAAVDGGAATIRVDGSQVASYTSNGGGSWNSGSTIGDLRPNRDIEFDGELDEIQVSNVVRTTAWQDATYRNQATTTDFYAVGAPQADTVRTFADVNTDALGDVMIESGAVVFPTGDFAIGGSFDNDSEFDANGGTVLFNSTTSAETIASGISSFYNLELNAAGGEWQFLEHATATNNIALIDAAALSFNLDVTLESTGTFSNNMLNAATDWSGATLKLSSGNDFTINDKLHGGDNYNILTVVGDTDIAMWNSTALTYDTLDTGSIYSQDHDGIDGDLYIFGNYVRDAGTEFWSYATDFDGADLISSSSERQVNVRVANGSSVVASSSVFEILGDAAASTTVNAQSGSFTLQSVGADLSAQYFEMTGTDVDGFQLLSSTTVTALSDTEFAIVPGSSAVTVDAATIDTNPGAQYFNTDFVTAGGSANVTLSGSPASFWWFRDGAGDRYGEAFDVDDGDPGSIRWDDSTYGITIAGTVYADDGVTPAGAAVCDDLSAIVQVAIDGVRVASTTCSSSDGSYVVSDVEFIGDPDVVVFLDNDVKPTPGGNISIRSELSGSGQTAAGTGNFTVNRPATVVNGDTLVAIIGVDDGAVGLTAPAGWTQGDQIQATVGNAITTAIFYKRVGDAATEPASYTFIGDTSETYSYWSGSLVNVDAANPQTVAFAGRFSNRQNQTSVAVGGVNIGAVPSLVLAPFYVDNDAAVTPQGFPWAVRAGNVLSTDNNNLTVLSRVMASGGITGSVSVSNIAAGMETNAAQFIFRRATFAPTDHRGAVVTRTPTADITDMDIYQNRVITRHEDTAVLGIANMTSFDSTDDSDIPFTASVGPNTLNVLPGAGLYVWNSTEFTPDGVLDLQGAGTDAADGSLTIGPGATYTSAATNAITVGGSMFVDAAGTFDGASSTVTFTATNAGQEIGAAASSTINLYDVTFAGSGGEWAVQTPVVVDQDVIVNDGTVVGISDITVINGGFSGDGSVAMTGGTVQINGANTLGGVNPWQFNNLVLGDGASAGITTPASTATTTVLEALTISSGHFLDSGSMVLDLAGSGTVFVEDGTFLEGDSTVRYSGLTPSILRTAYNNLVVDTDTGPSVTAIAPAIGLQILGDLTVGVQGSASIDLDTSDPLTAVGGDVLIGSLGTVQASDSNTLGVFGSWDNNGTFVSNGGLVEFLQATGTASIAAGDSSFGDVIVGGNSDYTFTESATSTGDFTIGTSQFVLQSGEVLSVAGEFSNNMEDTKTTWAGTTLRLNSGTSYLVNSKLVGDTYDVIEVSAGTHPRFWNSDASSYVTAAGSSVYSQDHDEVVGDLNIYGDFVNTTFADHWSYETDWDGVALVSPRLANVQIEDGGSVLYLGGSLTVAGSSTASTTISALGTGPFDMTLAGVSDIDMQYYSVRDIAATGLVFTGTPTITDLSFGDYEVALAGGSAITVGGGVISANSAKNFTNNRFATTTAINAFNVTATGTSLSSWRFVNVDGNLDGEAKDVDPAGDPGYVVWQDSAAIIDISGVVYQSDRTTVSAVCDGVTENIRLSIQGLTFASTTCAAGTGAYTFNGIGFGPSDTLTIYIDGEATQAAAVTRDPISLISDMDLYENHVIVRHESSAPQSIAAMSVYDSSDDADIPFTAVDAATDTLTLPADFALVVWGSKDFEPGGDVTLSGGGAGASYDGLLELFTNADYIAASGQTHNVGGSLLTAAGALLAPADADFNFTSTAASRTIDLNEAIMADVTFSGSGEWLITDPVFTATGDVLISAGDLTLPSGTTTIGSSFTNTGGAFDANSGLLLFNSSDVGNTIEFGGSDAATVLFDGVGDWAFVDVNATSTDSFTVTAGSVSLPSGVLTIGNDFIVTDTIAHNGGTVRLVGTSGGNVVTLSGNDLTDLTLLAPAGDYTLTDSSAALLGSLQVDDGVFTVGTGTVSIGGSFDATGGTFNNGSGTLLFNSADLGELIDPGANDLYNVVIAGAGGWTLADNATTTNNFSLTNAADFTVTSGVRLYVGNVFTNVVGGAATTWAGTTLVLDGSNEYEANVKVTATEFYENVVLGENTDISIWNSSASALTVPVTSSFYSQDNAGVDGDLYIYGDYHIATTTEYWSASTDFDGSAIGSPRQANVYLSDNSAVSLSGGTLEIVGTAAASTSIQNQGVGTFDLVATAGTFNAEFYNITNMSTNGLDLSGSVTIQSLSNGFFTQSGNNTNLITLVSGVIDNNASLLITDTGFASDGFTGGDNVSLNATTTNSWTFSGALGDLWGEGFDVDGLDDCSSVRWDNSSCLLVEQTDYRWRNDDGGEGAVDSEWYDTDWTSRQRVRVVNNDAATYTNAAVKITVPFDADMQSDFDDLRFADTDGVTLIDYWIERFTSGSEATVWIQTPTLTAESVNEFYMYYGNVGAASASDGSNVFTVIEDFEDNNLVEYTGGTGDLARFETNSSLDNGADAFGGGFALRAANTSDRTNDGIIRTDLTVSQDETLRYVQYIDTTAGAGDEVCTIFAANGTVASNQNYAICTDQIGIDRISIVEGVSNTEFSGTILASSTADFTDPAFGSGWYEFYVDWETDGTISVEVYFESTGVLVATTTVTDTTYTSGGLGFAYWFQNGGWDSFVSYPRMETFPTVLLGAEQSDGGATWANSQNTETGGFLIGETARLRVAIENTGLALTNQEFLLEFAPKLTAPTCEAVPAVNYSAVPVSAGCGVSALCMATSTSVTNNSITSDHLLTDAPNFVAGKVITDPANKTVPLDLGQNRYTELEYALRLTTNALNDAYCFRVTNDGASLDSYSNLPELTLAFDPVITGVTLNDGFDISLTPGATTTIIASSTVTDFNGFADLGAATTTFYKTSVGAACTPDDNNCYIATNTCSYQNCSGSSCSLVCEAPFAYHTDPTDIDGAEEWFAFMEVSDLSGTTVFDTSIGVDLLTLRALNVQNAIAYGTVDIEDDTGSVNPEIFLQNLGNEPIDVQISGTDMTDGVASVIPASQQLYATSTFTYGSCIGCSTLSVVGDPVEVDLPKPLTDSPVVQDEIYWGIEVPFGTASAPHTGINFFMAITD